MICPLSAICDWGMVVLCLVLGYGLVILHHDFPGGGGHEAVRGVVARPRQGPHFCARDEEEIVLLLRVEEVHGFLHLVVSGDAEWYDLQLAEARRHGENLEEKQRGLTL